jgi:hypothetical protein
MNVYIRDNTITGFKSNGIRLTSQDNKVDADNSTSSIELTATVQNNTATISPGGTAFGAGLLVDIGVGDGDTAPNGVSVKLYVDDGDGVLDAGDGAAIATTTTANIGGVNRRRYQFTGCLALRAAERFRGEDVVKVLEDVSATRGFPKAIRVDNGPEFISKSLHWWACFNKVKLDFSLQQGEAGLQPARKTHRECLHRIVQWSVPAGVSEPALVLVAGRCPGRNRILAIR